MRIAVCYSHYRLIILMTNLVKVESLEEHENPFEIVTPRGGTDSSANFFPLLSVSLTMGGRNGGQIERITRFYQFNCVSR